VEILFDPDKRSWPKTAADSNEFIRKYVHFQISNYLATDTKLEEAKQNVSKGYDRIVKRIQDMKTDDLYADYLDSFSRGLDPHSSFFSKDVLEDFEISMSLSLEGIGATLSSQDGFTVVEQLVPGGAAARCNCIQTQDKIVAVGQGETGKLENVIEMDLRDVVRKIRGEKGTKVRLTLLRKTGDSRERITVSLERDKIKLEDEAAQVHYIDKAINGEKKKIAILNLPSFYADSKRGGRSSASDLKKLIGEAVQNKAEGMVLDLASNGGGSLDDAVKIAGLFFQTGNVVKQSSREPGRGEATLKDIDPSVDWSGPLVVLTSRTSASASEIVAGTLQDYKRAVIVGADHTFGKGSVQSVVPMPQNLGALKVTVGMFFTSGGKSTQHRGVDADIAIPTQFASDEVGEKSLDYSLPPKEVAGFLSPEANPKSGSSQWNAIRPDWIKTLKERSESRVSKNDDFKKISEELKKSKDKGRLIKLSEVMKDGEDKEKKKQARNLAPAEKAKEYLKRADIQEAANVLTDLMSLEKGQPLALLETPPNKK
ncbi:MAG: S41 family peptidase, partial [Pseudobdellovibrionaceae bacterium]